MSLEKANAFIEKVRSDKTLREEAKGLGQDMGKLIALGKREGFEFGEDDFTTAVREAGYNIEDQLSDEELEGVAGGARTGVHGQCQAPSTNWPC